MNDAKERPQAWYGRLMMPGETVDGGAIRAPQCKCTPGAGLVNVKTSKCQNVKTSKSQNVKTSKRQ
ncbi:MAG: hypothetical protein ACE5EX_11215, partial [Phycisphaerae bacterium]